MGPSTGDQIGHAENRIGVNMAYFRGPEGASPGRASDPASAAGVHSGGKPAYPQRRSYAALDLGTNNCRMLIARPEGEGFTIIDAFSRIVRLGEGLAASGRLSDAAMDRTVSALGICATKLARRNVHLSRAVATEACRRASNGLEFVDRVARETGILLDIIPPGEEAKLAVLGCYRLLDDATGLALVFDIGGGSTELALIDVSADDPHTLDWLSIPWGVVSLSETVGRDGTDRAARLDLYQRMKAEVAAGMSAFRGRIAPYGHPTRLLGTSGTVTTLASVYLGLAAYDRRQIDGLRVPSSSLRDISLDLAGRSVAERAQLACIGSERADLVVAGCAILDTILDFWPVDDVGVADRGIREGILRQLVKLDRRR